MPSTTPDQGTILLYALSTLAQTCAALAALVGAVGLYRLQSLWKKRRDLFADISSRLGHPTMPEDAVVANAVAQALQQNDQALHDLVKRYHQVAPTIRCNVLSLSILEAWNLLVIGASLVGFNYVPLLVSSPWTFWALWTVALGTVAVTAYSVFAWTRDDVPRADRPPSPPDARHAWLSPP